MQPLWQRTAKTWGPWLLAPLALMALTLVFLWVGFNKCNGSPCLAYLVFFAMAAGAGVLSLLLTLSCHLPGPGGRRLGRVLYGVALALQGALFLLALMVAQ